MVNGQSYFPYLFDYIPSLAPGEKVTLLGSATTNQHVNYWKTADGVPLTMAASIDGYLINGVSQGSLVAESNEKNNTVILTDIANVKETAQEDYLIKKLQVINSQALKLPLAGS